VDAESGNGTARDLEARVSDSGSEVSAIVDDRIGLAASRQIDRVESQAGVGSG
jgi:hypothetical protein